MQVKKVLLLSCVVAISLNAFDLLGSAASSLKSKASNLASSSVTTNINDLKKNISLSDILKVDMKKLVDYNLVNIPGLFGLGFKCDLSKDLTIIDPCKLVKNKSTDMTFTLGSCKLGVNMSSQKAYDLVQKMCSLKDKKEKNPINTIRNTGQNIAAVGDVTLRNRSSSDKWYTGEERLKNIKTPDGDSLYEVTKKYFNPAAVYSNAIRNSGASSIFDSKIYEWKKCIKLHSKHPELCNTKDYTLPKTENDVDAFVLDTQKMLYTGLEDPMNDTFKNILVISNNYLQQCSDSKDPVQCENQVWENGYMLNGKKVIPKNMLTEQQQKIEIANSRLMSVIEEATMPKTRINFYSQEFIDSLPPTEKDKYKRLAYKAMMKKVVYNYYWDEITMQEKELLSIQYDLQKVAASNFYPKQAIDEVNNIVKIFEASNNTAKQ